MVQTTQTIELEIVTPERLVLSKAVDDVILPSVEGYMGVLAGHAPLLAQLQVGTITYRAEGRTHVLAVSGGFAEVLPHAVRVLAETCEPAEEIDLDRAQQARARAEQELQKADSDFERLQVSLKRAVNRIHAHDQRST
jgi:F-type H+-transporting ATPase subunit epsilon